MPLPAFSGFKRRQDCKRYGSRAPRFACPPIEWNWPSNFDFACEVSLTLSGPDRVAARATNRSTLADLLTPPSLTIGFAGTSRTVTGAARAA